MATTKCNISFTINYSSTLALTDAKYSYKLKNTSDIPTSVTITPLPVAGDLINIPTDSLTNGDYDLIVGLTSNGVSASQQTSFKIGNCNGNINSCEVPIINSVNLLSNGQIRMDYSVTITDLSTPEYQIATDINFANIINSRVGFNYTQIEDVNMNNIPSNTVLFIRARKYCKSSGGPSNWSNVFTFTSGKWTVQQAPYGISPACCVSGKFTNPTDINQVSSSICVTGNQWTKTVNLDTSSPQVGSRIYLSDGVTPAIPGNLSSFDNSGASGFNQLGIRWVRFSGINNIIYDVNPSTGIITGTSAFNCS